MKRPSQGICCACTAEAFDLVVDGDHRKPVCPTHVRLYRAEGYRIVSARTGVLSPAEPVCSECGMPGQCAGCHLMETQGIPTPPRVLSPVVGRVDHGTTP